MASLKTRERQLGNLEGFDVTFRDKNGRDVRSDQGDMPAYGYDRAAKDDMTVSEWRKKRFQQRYAGYRCDVLDANGKTVTGNTKLGNVRKSYQGD